MKRLREIGLIAIASTLVVPACSWGQAIQSVDESQERAEADRHRAQLHREALDEYTAMLASEAVDERLHAVKALTGMMADLTDSTAALELLDAARRDPVEIVARLASAAVAEERGRRAVPGGVVYADGHSDGIDRSTSSRSEHRLSLERERIDEYTRMLASDADEDKIHAVKGLSAMMADMTDPAPALALLEAAQADPSESVVQSATAAVALERAKRLGNDVVDDGRPEATRIAASRHRVQLERERLDEYETVLASDEAAARLHAVKALSAMVRDMIDPAPALALLESAMSDASEGVSSLAAESIQRWALDHKPDH